MDVKISFLNRSFNEEVYIDQPQGFEVHGRDSHVCRIKKSLYGLKQTPRAWYFRTDEYLQRMGFTKSEIDPKLCFILIGAYPLILVLYVDDLFLIGEEEIIARCKEYLSTKFKMKEIGMIHYFLGLEVWQVLEYFFGQGKCMYLIS
jgi:hypothetical protein